MAGCTSVILSLWIGPGSFSRVLNTLHYTYTLDYGPGTMLLDAGEEQKGERALPRQS